MRKAHGESRCCTAKRWSQKLLERAALSEGFSTAIPLQHQRESAPPRGKANARCAQLPCCKISCSRGYKFFENFCRAKNAMPPMLRASRRRGAAL
jgi:hypothetical protein